MKNFSLFFFAIPLLVTAVAQPQVGSLNTPNAPADCACPKESQDFHYPSCSGTFCECRNRAIVACWITRPAHCSASFQTCPNDQNGVTNDYPRCGKPFPPCAQGRICRQLDMGCNPLLYPKGCLGLCVPPPPAPPPTSLNPGWLGGNSNAPPASQSPGWFGNSGNNNRPPPTGQAPKGKPSCPASMNCPADMACVQDPHDTLVTLRGFPSWKCVDGRGVCGGFPNMQCPEGKLCIRDPRIDCVGQGCTGICA